MVKIIDFLKNFVNQGNCPPIKTFLAKSSESWENIGISEIGRSSG
jgi:hypothetical protein